MLLISHYALDANPSWTGGVLSLLPVAGRVKDEPANFFFVTDMKTRKPRHSLVAGRKTVPYAFSILSTAHRKKSGTCSVERVAGL